MKIFYLFQVKDIERSLSKLIEPAKPQKATAVPSTKSRQAPTVPPPRPITPPPVEKPEPTFLKGKHLVLRYKQFT